jgi:hypothetical protein
MLLDLLDRQELPDLLEMMEVHQMLLDLLDRQDLLELIQT